MAAAGLQGTKAGNKVQWWLEGAARHRQLSFDCAGPLAAGCCSKRVSNTAHLAAIWSLALPVLQEAATEGQAAQGRGGGPVAGQLSSSRDGSTALTAVPLYLPFPFLLNPGLEADGLAAGLTAAASARSPPRVIAIAPRCLQYENWIQNAELRAEQNKTPFQHASSCGAG